MLAVSSHVEFLTSNKQNLICVISLLLIYVFFISFFFFHQTTPITHCRVYSSIYFSVLVFSGSTVT